MKDILAKIFGGAAGGVADKLSGIVDKFVRTKDEKAAFDSYISAAQKGRLDESVNQKLQNQRVNHIQKFHGLQILKDLV